MIFIENKSKGAADQLEIIKLIKNLEKLQKNLGNYVENVPQNSNFVHFNSGSLTEVIYFGNRKIVKFAQMSYF